MKTSNTEIDITGQIKQIKQNFYTMMNGPVSHSMRDKGLDYKVNFGVELLRLQQYAKELPQHEDLAINLWKENIRECRLLATMLMPKERFSEDLATLWVEQIRFTEEADNLVFHLLSHVGYASHVAFKWLADERVMFRYVGYSILAALFAKKNIPSRRDMDEFLDQCSVSLKSNDMLEKKVAYKALLKFMTLGIGQERIGNRILEELDL